MPNVVLLCEKVELHGGSREKGSLCSLFPFLSTVTYSLLEEAMGVLNLCAFYGTNPAMGYG